LKRDGKKIRNAGDPRPIFQLFAFPFSQHHVFYAPNGGNNLPARCAAKPRAEAGQR